MSGLKTLIKLYRAHQADFRHVSPEQGDSFLCPICLQNFNHQDLRDGRLTDGHVWPVGVRRKSKVPGSASRKVLLCADCNRRAGSYGDRQMQLMEQIREGEETGEIYGERTIQIPINPGEKPITLRGRIRRKTPTSMTITGLLKNEAWVRSDPKDYRRFMDLLEQNRSFSLIEYPHHELKTSLVGAGWITSAYLMAFHALGYRYILHEGLDRVRDYILKSFDPASGDEIDLPRYDDFCIREFNDHYVYDPELSLIVPVNEEAKVHLEVQSLRYLIKLPFHYDPKILLEWLQLEGFEIAEGSLVGKDPILAPGFISARISCNKLRLHPCIFDVLMGMPIPDMSEDDD